MKRSAFAAALLLVVACQPKPPGPPVQRSGTQVNAGFGNTWDSVIDVFAERNIPIRTMDRSSGFISADPMAVGHATAHPDMYDCGTTGGAGVKLPATSATYNVLVRGDSAASTVKVTVRYVRSQVASGLLSSGTTTTECSTQGGWENRTEAEIKARAETKASAR